MQQLLGKSLLIIIFTIIIVHICLYYKQPNHIDIDIKKTCLGKSCVSEIKLHGDISRDGIKNLLNEDSEVLLLPEFKVKLSEEQHSKMFEIFFLFEKFMEDLKLKEYWFLGPHSLIGSLQHHDLMPWDEGADILIHIQNRTFIHNQVAKIPPELALSKRDSKDRLFFRESPTPFLEIVYYNTSSEDQDKGFINTNRIFKMKDVFPLSSRPLGPYWFPTPKRSTQFLKDLLGYIDPACVYEPFWPENAPSLQGNCDDLTKAYPFVQRCPAFKGEAGKDQDGNCDEYLLKGDGSIIHKIRTTLEWEDMTSPLFQRVNQNFQCPK